MKKIFVFAIVNLISFRTVICQNTGICAGKVVTKIIDAENKSSEEKDLVSANVFLYLKDSLIASEMTSDVGVYEFDKLKKGIYTIKVELAGFAGQEIKNVKVWQSKVTLVRRIYLVPLSEVNDKTEPVYFEKKK